MKKIVAILCCLVFAVKSFSQEVPGYQGNRFILHGNCSFSPFIGTVFGFDDALNWNLRTQAGFDFVVNRNTCIGLYADFINTQIFYTNRQYSNYNPCNPSLNQYSAIDVPVDLYGASYFFSWKKFSFRHSGAIAPLGRYVSVDIGYTLITAFDNGTFFQDKTKTNLGNYSTATLQFGMGKQTVIADRIVLDMGVKAGIALSGIINGRLADYNSENYGIDDLNYKIENKLYTSYLINATFGFGLLVK